MRHRGKAIALSTVAVGVVVLVTAGFASKDRILEEWYLWRLETGDHEAKIRALKMLAGAGSEESLIRITEYDVYDASYHNFSWGFPHADAHLSPESLAVSKQLSDVAMTVVWEIAGIGKRRTRAAIFRYMRDPGEQERTRVHFAQNVVLVTVPLQNLTQPFRRELEVFHHPTPDSQELQEFMGAKPAAIEVLLQALSSKDECCREGAAFALSFCGPEAAAAVPALKAVLADPEEMVSKPAAEALKKIQGDAG